MVSCPNISDLLPLYAGGDLEREEEARVREHVASCGDCARELEDYRLVLSALKEAQGSGAVPSLWPAVQEALKEPAAPALIEFRLPVWAACAAVLLVGLAIGLLAEAALPRAADPAPAASAPAPVKVDLPSAPAGGGNPVSIGGWEPEGRGDGSGLERRFHLQRVVPFQRRGASGIGF